MRKKLLFPVGICILLLSSLLMGVAGASVLDGVVAGVDAKGCSAIGVGRLATTDGSTLNGYTCDAVNDYRLRRTPAADHAPGSVWKVDYVGVEGNEHYSRGEVPQVEHTHQWFDIEVPVANEHSVFINENTDGSWVGLRDAGHETEAPNETGAGAYVFDWHSLMAAVLQRATTASEGVDVVAEMVEKYGMRGNAESFMISDPNEVWVVEVAGWSHMWLAQRIPDNAVVYHANRLRLQEIDFDDPDNFRYSKDAEGNSTLLTTAATRVITDTSHPFYVAGETHYYYEPDRDGAFNFQYVYSTGSRAADRREWVALSLLCPSVNWDPAAQSYPVWVIPEFKLDAEWIMDVLWRNVYNDTEYSLLEGRVSGPYHMADRASVTVPEGSPGVSNTYPIGSQTQTYCTVGVGRNWVPKELGLMWFCNNTARTGIFTPIYVNTTKLPDSWWNVDWETDPTTGAYVFKYDDESVWWQFQAMKALCNLRYKDMIADVRGGFSTGRGIVTEHKGFDVIEADFRDAQDSTEMAALALQGQSRIDYLSNYTFEAAEATDQAVRDMIAGLLTKYKNGAPGTEIDTYWADLYKVDNPDVHSPRPGTEPDPGTNQPGGGNETGDGGSGGCNTGLLGVAGVMALGCMTLWARRRNRRG